ncbi:MAG: integrin alpha [Actinomycetota bacterium]|nr:integrin alpha [Actinomycetota bacterium]
MEGRSAARLARAVFLIGLIALPVSSARAASAAARVPADFNGDGYSDLAVGTLNDDGGTVDDAGSVNVLYGSASGLSAANDQQWHQDSLNVSDQAEAGDAFGASLASGDLNDDGYADLAVGAPGEDVLVGATTVEDAGVVHVFFGSPDGLVAAAGNPLTQGSGDVPGVPEAGDLFGEQLAAGNLDDHPRAELVIAAPWEAVSGEDGTGTVTILFSDNSGLFTAGSTVWHQDQPRLLDDGEENEFFGSSLAIGNLGKTPHGDLVIGVARENVDLGEEGAVHVLYGSDNGPRKRGQRFLHGNNRGIPGKAQYDSAFGQNLEIANFGKSRQGDLAIAAPRRRVGGDMHGSVYVLYGTPTGVSTDGADMFHQDTHGVRGEVEFVDVVGEGFGHAVTGADLGGSKHADLAVGVYYESVGDVPAAGASHVLFGSKKGVIARGDLLLTQTPPDVPTDASQNDQFGWSLALANFGRTERADLAVASIGEDVNAFESAGAVTIFYGRPTGPDPSVGELWSQATTDVEGDVEAFDFFGTDLEP